MSNAALWSWRVPGAANGAAVRRLWTLPVLGALALHLTKENDE
jgi:hypothetical protein